MVQSYSEKAGQWSKNQAIKTQERFLGYIYFGTLLFVTILAFLAGLSFNVWWICVAFIVFALTSFLTKRQLLRKIDELFQHWSKQRLRYLRGGQAEAWVSLQFRDALNDDWHLFDNLKLDANSDIDHVLIGPGGFFIISTKSHRGLFQASNTQPPTFNLQSCNWSSDATRQAMRLKDQLAVIEPIKQPWIQTVLALPFAHVDAGPAKTQHNERLPGNLPIPGVNACWVLHEDTLLNAIAPDPIPKPRKLPKQEIERWAAAVEKLHKRSDTKVAKVAK